MSNFLDFTPTVQIKLDNPLLEASFPSEGSVSAVIDTGYEGFVLVPRSVFHTLGLNKLRSESRRLTMANGSPSKTQGAYAVLRIPHISLRIDGFVETLAGLEEILVGVEALSKMRVLLDYCAKRVSMEKCNRP
ncbi:MAG TPA: clan AA aspartic protease [Nitrososphaerales archaeon]|nr:clan AA aspartic protease [Nitrososphaerales archaeon]